MEIQHEKKHLGLIGLLAIALILMAAALSWWLVDNKKIDNTDENSQIIETQMPAEKEAPPLPAEPEIVYLYQGKLKDVTDGVVRGIKTGGKASGVAKAGYADGIYNMKATFENLPKPKGDDFYEGWVVRQEPFAFISTGKVKKVNGEYQNIFDSKKDYTKYNQYILTLEPNDGDPEPADHIVEGVMSKK